MKKSILITGSNKGIGFEIARQLGAQGHKIYISGRNESRVMEAQEKLQSEGIDAGMLHMDVSNHASILDAVMEFASFKTKLDVIINNAAMGSNRDKSLLSDDEDILTQTLLTNSYGPLRVTRSFLPFLKSPGRIIMVSSGDGAMSYDNGGWWPAYGVSKTLLNAITRKLAMDLQTKHIAVNAVCPGWVQTDMGGSEAPRSIEQGAQTPVWLALEADQNITGQFFRDKKVVAW